MPIPSVAAIILAAGQGTRMKSALPKVLHPACGKPLFAWPVEAALAAGASPVVLVVGHGRDQVEAEGGRRFGDKVRFAVQSEQRGTGHAARMALPALGASSSGFNGTVLVLYGDTPLLTVEKLVALVELRVRTGAPLALWTTHLADPTGYGRIVRGPDGLLDRIVEHKDATEAQRKIDEVNPGVYAVDAAFLRTALSSLQANNAQGEEYLTDVVAQARAIGHGVPTLEVPAEETLGVNDRAQLAEAAEVLQARVVRRAMLAGVTFEKPRSVVVHDDVRFGADVVVGPNVTLTGDTLLGAGVTIGAGVVLHDTQVGPACVVHPYSVCDGARLSGHVVVGPFARLRPGAVLEEGAHVGNFVELKKTRLGKGSKANHLAYLGDADIGAGTNVGAGTITCNYDGFGKHLTAIGDEVFVGSNATLVAPLTIHRRAYVAAGSTVTADVPEDAVVFGRARQENKAGRATQVRATAAARAGKKPPTS
jgi:bifunctional UDP-N-acetylglucosamine pyrophosphorylase/glucosamine-1-phosphate N-acetyltransferase